MLSYDLKLHNAHQFSTSEYKTRTVYKFYYNNKCRILIFMSANSMPTLADCIIYLLKLDFALLITLSKCGSKERDNE